MLQKTPVKKRKKTTKKLQTLKTIILPFPQYFRPHPIHTYQMTVPSASEVDMAGNGWTRMDILGMGCPQYIGMGCPQKG